MSNDANMSRETSRKVALATLEGVYTVRGHKLNVDVSPCTYMYHNNRLQVGFKMSDGSSWGCVSDAHVNLLTATRADVQRMLDSTLLDKICARCNVSFVAEPGSNRGELCETCWSDDFKKECDRLEEKDRKAVARKDARMAKKGYTHRASVWVHPGGDDYLVDIYSKGEPKKEEIERFLRRKGSRVLDDYTVKSLND